MKRFHRRLRHLVLGLVLLPLAVGWLLAQGPLPAPNGLLKVKADPKTFLPNPAAVGQTVTAVFHLMINDPTYRQEVQTQGIESQQLIILMEGGGGKVTAVKLKGINPIPKTKMEADYKGTFTGLTPGETQTDKAGLTLTVSASGDKVTITGTKGSPLIRRVEVEGHFTSAGDKDTRHTTSERGLASLSVSAKSIRKIVRSTNLNQPTSARRPAPAEVGLAERVEKPAFFWG
jgi:hypothetical protein